MAADASILADQFFKDAYLLRSVIGNGYDVLGPVDDVNEQTVKAKEFLESQHKEAFDAYKLLFVKFKGLVNTRKKVIAAEPVAAPGPSPAINSHTKNELGKQYEKQLKELAASISDSSSVEDIIKGSVDIIARDALAGRVIGAGTEQIKRIFTEFLKIRVKGGLEKGKFLMDELFDEPEELNTIGAQAGVEPPGNNLRAIRLKVGDDILTKFKAKYAYIKEVYSEGDRKFIDTILTALKKENAYRLDLQYTLAKLVPEFIPFTQAGRLVKDINTYIQSGSPISPGRDELVDAVRTTASATGEALRKAQAAMDERERIHGQLDGLLASAIAAKAAASSLAASPADSAAYKAAYKLLDETNSKYFKAFSDSIQADLDYKAANNLYWDALKNLAPAPREVTEAIDAGTIPRGTPVVTAVKILALRGLDLTNVPFLKKEIEKVDKYIKAIAAVEELRANKDDPVAYVQKRSVVNTLFTEKGFLEFFSKHLPEGFIEKLETDANYKELLKNAIFGEEFVGKKEEGEAGEAEAEAEAEAAARGKKGYTEADNTYKVANLSFFDKLAGKALNKKELAEWWKKRGGKFNIGQTIPEPIVTIFTETFNLKKKSKKTVRFTENFLIEGVKEGAVTSSLASSPAPSSLAGPAPAEENSLEVSAKGFANNGIYDQEDGPPISSVYVRTGTEFETYYLGWLDKNVQPIPAGGAAASSPAAAASSPAAAPAAAAAPAPAAAAASSPAAAASSPAASPAAAAPAAAAPAAAAVEEEAEEAITPEQKKAITKMMKSLFSFVFSDIQVRDANKEKRFHDAYRIAYTVLEKHQKIPCKAENPELHKYFKKSLEYRKEIAIRELAATKMVGQVVTPGMQDHFTQLITGLSGLITFLDNAVEGQPCIVYGDTLAGEDTAQEGDVNSELLLQLLTQYIKQRKNGSRPLGKDGLMAFLKQQDVPRRDINEVYKELESMLTDYAKLTKENPELRDLVVLFSQIALHIQQLGDIRLELEKLQHQMDKCADDKEKERLAELLAARGRELADKEAEMEALNRDFQAGRETLLAKIAELEEEIRRKDEDFEVMEGKRNDSLQEVARLEALIAGLEARLAAAEAEAAKVPGLEANLDEANEELAAKKAEIQALRAQLAGAEKEAAKVPGLNADIAALEAELQALRARLAVADEEAAKVPGLEANLDEANEELAAKKAELQALRAELAAAEAEAAKVPGLNARIAGLEDELARLRALKPQADRVPGLEDELARLRALKPQADRVPGLEDELARLRALKPQADRVPGLEADIAALETEVARLRALKPQADRVPGLEADIAALETEVARLRAQLAGVGGKAGEDAATIAGLQAELAALRAQLEAAIARAKEAEEALRRCGEENARLKAENDRLRAALDDCERQKAELEAPALAASPPPPIVVASPPVAKPTPKLRKSTLKLIAGDIDELGPICFYVFFKTYLYHDFEGSSITATSYDIHGQIISTKRTLRRIYDTKEFISMLYPKIFEKIRGGPPRGKEADYTAEWKNTALWFMFHLIRRIGELYLGVKGVQVPKSLVEPATKINFDSVDKMEIKDYIIILFNQLSTFLGIIDAASIRNNLLKKSGNLQRSLQDTTQQLYVQLQSFNLTTPESILLGIENTCMRGLTRQLKEEEEGAAAGGGGGRRRPQIGGGRSISVKSLSQGMLLLFLVELRKSKQLKSAKEVQDLVNKAGKALDSIGQYELVLTILQEIVGNINIHTKEGYTYVKLHDLKEEKANALVESYNDVFSKSDSKMFKTLGIAGSFHASAPEEFEEVLGKGAFCLVLDEGEGEGKEETPLHGVSDEYDVVLEEKERKVLEDNGIPLGGVIFLYLVCLNELYCDSSDEECIRPTI